MPLTLTLDDATAALLTQEAARSHRAPEDILSRLVTRHIPRPRSATQTTPYRVRTFHSEFQPEVNISKLSHLLDEEDLERFLHKPDKTGSEA